MEEEDKVSIFDAKFWVKDDTEEGKLKPEEIDAVRAKFLAARAARQAKKAAQVSRPEQGGRDVGGEGTATDVHAGQSFGRAHSHGVVQRVRVKGGAGGRGELVVK
eukprot:750655-Hanusia_phi.AAC.2